MEDSILETARPFINQLLMTSGKTTQTPLFEVESVLFFLGFSWNVGDTGAYAKWVLTEQMFIGQRYG